MAFFQGCDLWLYISLLYAPVGLLYVIYTCSIVIVTKKSWNKPVLRISAAWRAIIDITLIGGLKSETTEDGSKRYFLFDYPVTPKYVRAIGVFTLGLWLSLLATFWLSFIIKITEDCNDGIDCFNASGFPIEDCRSIDSFNSSIQCYEFQFDFINGAGTAGGLLAISTTILYGQLTAQMWLKKKISKSKSKEKKRHLKALSYLLGIVPMTFELILLILSMIKFFNATINRRVTAIPNYLNAVFYLTPLLTLSLHPLRKKTRLSTDPEEDSPGPDSYTIILHDEEQPLRTRAHTIL